MRSWFLIAALCCIGAGGLIATLSPERVPLPLSCRQFGAFPLLICR